MLSALNKTCGTLCSAEHRAASELPVPPRMVLAHVWLIYSRNKCVLRQIFHLQICQSCFYLSQYFSVGESLISEKLLYMLCTCWYIFCESFRVTFTTVLALWLFQVLRSWLYFQLFAPLCLVQGQVTGNWVVLKATLTVLFIKRSS